MSSAPGLGHASAHHHDDRDGRARDYPNVHDYPDDTDDAPPERIRDGAPADGEHEGGHADERAGAGGGGQQGDELASVHGRSHGLTFARPRPAGRDRPASLESTSTPDDTPSVQGSVVSASAVSASAVSSPRSSVAYSYNAARPNRPALQPFDRRFSSRLSPSPLATPRGPSPAFLSAHSRQSSLSSNLLFQHLPDQPDAPHAPWDVVRWTRLRNITAQLFSELGKRSFGRPTCLNVAASLAVGTSKGFVLLFDYQQVLKSIVGPGTKGKHAPPI